MTARASADRASASRPSGPWRHPGGDGASPELPPAPPFPGGYPRQPGPAPALAAARGFAEGNGYLTGQMVDRRA